VGITCYLLAGLGYMQVKTRQEFILHASCKVAEERNRIKY